MEKIAILRWESGHVPQGLMQLEQLPGNSTNLASYPFPVKLVEVKGANTDTVILHPSQKLLEDMIQLAKELEKEGAVVTYFDPWVKEYKYKGQVRQSIPALTEQVLKDADLVMVTTAHTNVDYDMVQKNAALIFDSKNAMKNIQNRDNIEVL